MAVYSFVCSSPDNWSNWHIWVKTFGPGIITACVTGPIAFAAYIVARTQREIAANKYDLDLFDKRYPLFEKINELAEKIEKYNTEKECINIDIQSLDNNNKLISHFDRCIDDIRKIRDFGIDEVKSIYDEINKSVRLYKNITPEKVSFLKENIKIIEENQENEYKIGNSTNLICDITNSNLTIYLRRIHGNIPKALREAHLQGLEKEIQKNEQIIYEIKEKIRPYDTYDDMKRIEIIKRKEEFISSVEEAKSTYIENEIHEIKEYEKFLSYISKSFISMENIKSCIIYIRDEMNEHLNISEVSYRK